MDDDLKQSSNAAPPSASMKERPTLKTIAFMTGLGITTVSRALKDAPDIGAETKQRVRMVARQLGYQPNRAGVRLRTGKTNVIALVLSIDEEIMGFSSQIMFGISEVLSNTPYHIVVTPHSHSKDPMQAVRYILDTGSADGIIISRTEPDDPRVNLLLERGLPFATHGRTASGAIHPYYDFDNEAFAHQAVEKLAQRGRKRIALLGPSSKLTYYTHTRDGFRTGLRTHGLAEVAFNTDIDASLETIRRATEGLMRMPDAPDAVVCSASSAAIAVHAGIEAAGKRLGHDLDLISKESVPILNWIRPEIITAREDFRIAGRELAKAVIASIDGVEPHLLQSISQPVWKD
ncbi:LacI family transcriptional regulator [Rhizobium sp.]|jgi:LacI family transcriptional regulator|uniref:LacI family transcriptional regulator n=1 Tax=Rhizobium sp. TaxID=391 RepID=UPI000E9766C8|nr:LacI family transcriptional regulator [Rhizobium sp.]